MKYKTLFRKLAKSKKGFDDDFVDIIIGVIFIALIFIVVFIYITNTQVRIAKAIEEESNNLEKDYILLDYLRTPMEESKIPVAEYLGFATKKELEGSMEFNGFCYEGKVHGKLKEGLLTKETKEILKDITNWRVGMFISERKEFCYIAKEVQKQKGGYVIGETVKAIIPSNDPSFNIEMYFTKS